VLLLLHAARRIAIMLGAIVGVTVAASLLIGLVVGSSIARSVSVGFYCAGVALLVGCFVVGARGPLRGVNRTGETVGVIGARRVRRATGDERSASVHTAILLFSLGLALVVVAALIDPAHQAF
jgi:hypothetical protein